MMSGFPSWIPDPAPTAGNVEALCLLMVKFGLTELQAGTVHLKRPAPPPIAPEAKEDEEHVPIDPVQLLHTMSPDKVDAALALGNRG